MQRVAAVALDPKIVLDSQPPERILVAHTMLMTQYEQLLACEGFQWDDGNLLKNWEKHRVTALECEQVFFNQPLLAFTEIRHSGVEHRIFLLGQSDEQRRLFVVIKIRGKLIRVISAREMSRKERTTYDRKAQE